MPLTKRQKEILDFLQGFLDENGYAPSFEEIAKRFNYASLATVHEHLENLRQKGYIRKSYNASRSIELVPAGLRIAAIELPLLGNVAAGMPIETIEEQETIAVPEDLLGRSGSHYVLRVKGDSMIDEQIRDGRRRLGNGEEVLSRERWTRAAAARQRDDAADVLPPAGNRDPGNGHWRHPTLLARGILSPGGCHEESVHGRSAETAYDECRLLRPVRAPIAGPWALKAVVLKKS
jgi:repressor LexA